MKKLVVLFVAITFLATFTLIGCNQSAAAAETSTGEGSTWSTWSAWSTWSTCASTGEGAWSSLEHLERLERLEHLEHLRQHQKKSRRGISGYILAKRIYPKSMKEGVDYEIKVIELQIDSTEKR